MAHPKQVTVCSDRAELQALPCPRLQGLSPTRSHETQSRDPVTGPRGQPLPSPAQELRDSCVGPCLCVPSPSAILYDEHLDATSPPQPPTRAPAAAAAGSARATAAAGGGRARVPPIKAVAASAIRVGDSDGDSDGPRLPSGAAESSSRQSDDSDCPVASRICRNWSRARVNSPKPRPFHLIQSLTSQYLTCARFSNSPVAHAAAGAVAAEAATRRSLTATPRGRRSRPLLRDSSRAQTEQASIADFGRRNHLSSRHCPAQGGVKAHASCHLAQKGLNHPLIRIIGNSISRGWNRELPA